MVEIFQVIHPSNPSHHDMAFSYSYAPPPAGSNYGELTTWQPAAAHEHNMTPSVPRSTNVLSIQSLLNPVFPAIPPSNSRPAQSSPSRVTPSTIQTGGTRRQKLIKDNAVFTKSAPAGAVRYPPYECSDDALSLPQSLQHELVRQHLRFRIFPNGSERDGCITEYTRHIPYASEKKGFFDKTGREAFDGTSVESLLSPSTMRCRNGSGSDRR